MVNNDLYLVKTSDEFQKFSGIKKVLSSTAINLKFSNGESIKVTPGHAFYDINTGSEIIASTLKVNDYLNNNKIIYKSTSKYKEPKEFYDLVEVQNGHHYTTNNIESHNCGFIRTTLWNEFADSVFPAQDALAEKQTILSSTPNGLNHWFGIVSGAEKLKEFKISKENPEEIIEIKTEDGRLFSIQEYIEYKKTKKDKKDLNDN